MRRLKWDCLTDSDMTQPGDLLWKSLEFPHNLYRTWRRSGPIDERHTCQQTDVYIGSAVTLCTLRFYSSNQRRIVISLSMPADAMMFLRGCVWTKKVESWSDSDKRNLLPPLTQYLQVKSNQLPCRNNNNKNNYHDDLQVLVELDESAGPKYILYNLRFH